MYKKGRSRLAASVVALLILASLVGQTAAVVPTSDGVQSDVQSIPACVGDLPRVDEVGNQTYGGDDDDIIFDATQTANQTLLAGSTKSYNREPELREETNYDGWVVALHPNGTERWNESYGDDSGHSGYAITNGADTGALLIGTANEQDTSETDGWAVRISDNGSVVWNRTFGDSGEYDRIFDAAPAPGGGFYIVGETTSVADNRFESEHSDAWLLEVNESGTVVRERVVGGYNATYGKADSFTGIQKTTDGYLVWGQTESLTPKTYAAAWLLKLNQSGWETWNHTYANGQDRNINDVSQRDEDEVVVVGRSDETDSEGAWLASLSTNGELRWDRTYGGSIDRFESIAGLDQSGYLVSGSTWTCSSEDSYADFSLTKIRPNTSVKWASQYGGPRADQSYEAVSPRTGRLLLVGSTDSFGDNGWVVEVPIDPEVLPLGPSYRPPQDRDLDGLFNDVNGDGKVTSADPAVLFAYRDSDRVQSSSERFDFNDDGIINILDVQALSTPSRNVGPNVTAGMTSVALSPANATVGSGERTTVQVVVGSAAGGVGAQNITVRTNGTVATIANSEPSGTPGDATTTTMYGEDNRSVTIVTAQADTPNIGAVTTANVTLAGQTVGTTDLNLTVTTLGNETGTPYVVSSITNATLTVKSGQHESGVSQSVFDAAAGKDGELSRDDVLKTVRGYLLDQSVGDTTITRQDVLRLVQYYLTQ